MFKKSFLSLLMIILSLSLLTGCGSTTPGADSPVNAPSTAQTGYPLTVKDDTGANVTLTVQPQRIVSLAPSATETLFTLGLDKNVVAVSKWDDYPKDVRKKVEYVFEDSLKPNIEQILKLNPDLIILGKSDPTTVESIRNLKIPVLLVNPQSLSATYRSIETIGQLTNTQEQAKKLVAEMQAKERSIESKVATLKDSDRLKVWTEVDDNLFTPGEGTFLNELLTKAGGLNIALDVKGWGQYNSEQIITKNPQVILETYSYYNKDAVANILARKGWQTVDAVKNKRVVALDSDMVTRPGPRIVDGLESIAKALYPDLFKSR